jgi:TetR/AcrR family transcriptional repressor of nem operon
MDSRENIIMTSYKLFLQKSYKEVTMKEIADKVGMTKGSFYHYFKSKEEIFSEIINEYFLNNLSSVDYGNFSQDSLQQFYKDYLLHTSKTKHNLISSKKEDAEDELSINPLVLIFEAFKILPEFKIKMTQLFLKEQKAWEKIIKHAKTQKEIKSDMSDEHIAKLFIYSNDGCGLHYLREDKSLSKVKKDLMPIYDGIYKMLK